MKAMKTLVVIALSVCMVFTMMPLGSIQAMAIDEPQQTVEGESPDGSAGTQTEPAGEQAKDEDSDVSEEPADGAKQDSTGTDADKTDDADADKTDAEDVDGDSEYQDISVTLKDKAEGKKLPADKEHEVTVSAVNPNEEGDALVRLYFWDYDKDFFDKDKKDKVKEICDRVTVKDLKDDDTITLDNETKDADKVKAELVTEKAKPNSDEKVRYLEFTIPSNSKYKFDVPLAPEEKYIEEITASEDAESLHMIIEPTVVDQDEDSDSVGRTVDIEWQASVTVEADTASESTDHAAELTDQAAENVTVFAKAILRAAGIKGPATDIEQLDINIMNGSGELGDDVYTFTPEKNSAGTQFITYTVTAKLSGSESHAPGTIEFRIPGTLFVGRTGNSATHSVDLPVPPASNPGTSTYVYRYDKTTDEYVITNVREAEGGHEAVFNIRYNMNAPSEIISGSTTSGFSVKLNVTEKSGEVVTKEASSPDLKVITSSKLGAVNKYGPEFYQKYPSGWGTPSAADADNNGDGWSDDYFYVTYKLRLTESKPGTNTEPYTLKFTDNPDAATHGEVVGYKRGSYHWADSQYGSMGGFQKNPVVIQRSYPSWISDPQFHFYDGNSLHQFVHVLVRYPRSEISNLKAGQSKTFVNYFTADFNTWDNGTTDSKTASCSFRYDAPQDFYVPGGTRDLRKGPTNFEWYYGYADILEKGNNKNIKYFSNSATVQNYAYTYEEPADLTKYDSDPEKARALAKKDPANYGKKPVQFELIDDMTFYDTGESSDRNVVNPYQNKLQPGDYQFTRIKMNGYSRSKWVFNRDTGKWVGSGDNDLSHYTNLTVWTQDSSGNWSEFCKAIKNNKGEAVLLLEDGTTSKDYVELPAGTVGVKMTGESTAYSTTIGYYVEMEMLASEHVKQVAADRSYKAGSINSGPVYGNFVRNVNTLVVKNHKGALINTPAVRPKDYEKERWSNYAFNTHDAQLYGNGTKLHHAEGEKLLAHIPTTSYMYKYSDVENQVQFQRVKIDYRTTVAESAYYEGDAGNNAQLINDGVFNPQQEGTFYDLLPPGVDLDENTIRAYPAYNTYRWKENQGFTEREYGNAWDEIPKDIYEYDLTENWRGTGRTLLTIHLKIPEGKINAPYKNGYREHSSGSLYYVQSGFQVKYSVYYDYNEIQDYGVDLRNSIGYETGNASIEAGKPDNGGSIKDAKLFKDVNNDSLSGEGAPNTFLYAEKEDHLNVVTATSLDLTKSVTCPDVSDWRSGHDGSVLVPSDGEYSYQIRFGASAGSEASNIIVYDSLENYRKNEDETQWKGTLTGFDMSQLVRRGIDYVVYYSTAPELAVPSNLDNSDYRDISDTRYWSTVKPSDPSEITAIAVDMRKDTEGGNYVLGEQQVIKFEVKMKAPSDVLDLEKKGAHAYNNVYLSNSLKDKKNGKAEDFVVHMNYTQVGVYGENLDIDKSSVVESGTEEEPAAIKYQETVTYDVTLINKTPSVTSKNVVIKDQFPDYMDVDTSEIKVWYESKGKESAVLIDEDENTQVSLKDGNLIFNIKEIKGGEKIHFMIPGTATRYNTVYHNQAKITEVDGTKVEIEAPDTWHKTPMPAIEISKSLDGYYDGGANSDVTMAFEIKAENKKTGETQTRYAGLNFKKGENLEKKVMVKNLEFDPADTDKWTVTVKEVYSSNYSGTITDELKYDPDRDIWTVKFSNTHKNTPHEGSGIVNRYEDGKYVKSEDVTPPPKDKN